MQSSDYEGTPNAVLEAMALGTPIIATAAGDPEARPSWCRGADCAVRECPGTLGAIEMALTDGAGRRNRAAAARARIESDLSFERRMRRVEMIYREVMAPRVGKPQEVASTMPLRELIKTLALSFATVAVSPALLSFWVRISVHRARSGARRLYPDVVARARCRGAVLPPCLPGAVPRAVRCVSDCGVRYLFSQTGSRLERNTYIGPGCHLGLVHLEADVLIGAGVHIPSGGATHGIADLTVPIREQPGERRMVRIGRGSWIGSAAIVLADVGRDTVVGAGSVVIKPLPDRVIAAGVPAKVVRSREDSAATRSDLRTA